MDWHWDNAGDSKPAWEWWALSSDGKIKEHNSRNKTWEDSNPNFWPEDKPEKGEGATSNAK